ncbi:hypothetical protein CBE01nite_29630 [Clostridium beijerinckii]|uniref:Phage gp6-like head-tail connector protein n=1 Tax=Clostridium beijerinckii TaxID=1520 RepID=A0AB74VD73_CLOBE|nr:hypothetical protein [Clostridium beijerinckii]NRZ28743.1 hypothetical protein [Clostridium beijerinckii]NYB95481.1 hypothetical protein [Clostridium beijerinckii]OOM24596.1 hypothetical protein CLBEI_20570 [Clostridium beijerinckii]QUN34421.1 hypothetical protein KEC93_21230 [Clostridium beijerinckii]SQB00625.1 Uncharacterised protein [Clostridium beijerinckii]
MTDDEYELTAICYIRRYLNKDDITDEEIKTKYSIVVKRIVMKLKEIDDLPVGVLSTKSNDVSTTYMENNNNVMTKDITMLLPVPYIRLF